MAFIERQRAGRVSCVFPGGGVDRGETWDAAALREYWKELGVVVRVGRLAARVRFEVTSDQRYFLALVESGVFGTGPGEEMARAPDRSSGSCRPLWASGQGLTQRDGRPRGVAEALVRGLPDGPLEIVDPAAAETP